MRIDGIGDVGYLKAVFYVSALSFNLISEGLLDRAGYELTGRKGTRTWKFEDGTLFLTAQLNASNLYQADMSYLGVPMLIQEEPEYNALIYKAEASDTLLFLKKVILKVLKTSIGCAISKVKNKLDQPSLRLHH